MAVAETAAATVAVAAEVATAAVVVAVVTAAEAVAVGTKVIAIAGPAGMTANQGGKRGSSPTVREGVLSRN